MPIKDLMRDALGLVLAAAVVLFAAGGTVWALDVEKELKALESTYCKKVSGSNMLRLEKCIEKEKKAKMRLEKDRKYSLNRLLCQRKLGKDLSYEMVERCIVLRERPKTKEKTSRKGEVVPFPKAKKTLKEPPKGPV